MRIRNYSDEDFPKVEKLLKDSKIYWPNRDKREIIKSKINKYPESIILAEEDDHIIGVVFIVYDTWISFVLHLAVDSMHRKKGVGGILFQIAEQRLKAKGVHITAGFIDAQNKEVLEYCKKRGWFISGNVYFINKNL